MTPAYAPLWCKSNFSFLEGASNPDELVGQAHHLGIRTLGLADRDGVYGMVRAHVAARQVGVRIACGAQLTVADGPLAASPLTLPLVGLHTDDHHHGRGPGWSAETDDLSPRPTVTGHRARAARSRPRQPALSRAAPRTSRIVLYAIDRAGWSNLVRLITAGRRRCDKGESLVGWDEVCARSTGLIALWHDALADEHAPPAQRIGDLRDAFGDRLYALLDRHLRAEDAPREARLRARAAEAGLPLVAGAEVLYHSRARRPLQDVMTCIRHGTTLTTAGRLLRGNDEYDLRAPAAFAKLFADDPDAIARTLEIAARCTFSLDELRYRYPSERLPDGTTTAQHLRALTEAGARGRYGGVIPADVRKQIDAELSVIEDLDYGGYFLTMHEIVSYCRRKEILCQGRGSAANSAVCFCLGITAVDPVGHGLLFERFLSRERAEPPDIDLDIEHERREEVIQHVYRVYGRDHAAMVCNINRYRSRSAVREVGKVLGIPETALERAAKFLSPWGADIQESVLAGAGVAETVKPLALQHLTSLSNELLEFPRHLSIHPGGFLLGSEPVHDLVPIENASMPGRTVIQWDKNDLEDLGMFKVDLLALGALHLMHLAFDLIRHYRGLQWTMATIPQDDKNTYDMICTADTIGTFQIESRAQMSMLPRLKPEKLYDLVIQVSIVRPGPITGGMVHPYLRRRAGIEPVTYPHPCLEEVLERTKGVPLFQEQVMRLAIVAANYTPGEADQLRKDMAAWRSTGRIEQHRHRLISAMEKKGIAAEFAKRVFEQIRGFGEYGFPESHAMSFALIAYATSWLRKHYLPEFTCALLNAQPMGFYSPSTIIGDAQRHALEVRPIDVAHSEWDCTLEPANDDYGFAVRMGLRWVQGIQHAEAARITAARRERPFASIGDFVQRARVSTRAHTALAEAGSLGVFAPSRRDALWQVAGWVRRDRDELPIEDGGDIHPAELAPLDHLEEIQWDHRTTGHSTLGHPLGPFRAELRARGLPDARTLACGNDGQRVRYAGLVICRQRPGTASGVTFMTLEDETGLVNLIVWARVFDAHPPHLRMAPLVGVSGKLQKDAGIVHVIVDELWEPTLSREVALVESRDFH